MRSTRKAQRNGVEGDALVHANPWEQLDKPEFEDKPITDEPDRSARVPKRKSRSERPK